MLRTLLMAAIVAAVAFGIYWGLTSGGFASSGESSTVPTAPVRLMNLRDKVIEQGALESQSTVTGVCEIDHHENKIIFLVPEGSIVKKGQVVCKFDSSEFEEYVSERESRVNESRTEVENAEQDLIVQKDTNDSAIREAKQAMEFAKLDLDKYIHGDYEVKKSDLQGAISEAETEYAKAKRQLVSMRALVKRGFRDFEQLRSAEQVVKSTQLRLTRDRQKLTMLDEYEHVKSKAEFQGKHTEAINKYENSKSTAEAKINRANDLLKNAKQGLRIQERRLKQLKEALEKHVMTAPQDGTIAYADDWRSRGEKLHEGSTIYQNQPVFVLPDMARMQVKVGVHESLVSKIKPGQKAIVRVEAYSSIALQGSVKSVSPLAAASPFGSSNNYDVIVKIDKFPEGTKLKPGMTAEVEILVGQYPDVLAIPIQAVASFGHKKFVFVQSGRNFEPRPVDVGKSNISFVEITSGLKENEVVALDAYQRAIDEFGDQEPEDDPDSDQFATESTSLEDGQVGMTSEESVETDLPPKPRVDEPDSDVAESDDSETDDSETDDSETDDSETDDSGSDDSGSDEARTSESESDEAGAIQSDSIKATSPDSKSEPESDQNDSHDADATDGEIELTSPGSPAPPVGIQAVPK